MTLNELFEQRQLTPHNINEHMVTLASYALHVQHIVEIGTDIGFSTISFLTGKPKRIDCYDIARSPFVDELEKMAKEEGIGLFFHPGHSFQAEVPECDLLFIDSDHTPECLGRELALHANKSRGWLILHDTVSSPDMLPALYDFLETNPHWKLERHYDHQNGLTIYRRVENANEQIAAGVSPAS